MVTPTVIPRESHPISRSLIDPDALKVLQRLRRYTRPEVEGFYAETH